MLNNYTIELSTNTEYYQFSNKGDTHENSWR